MMGYGMENKGLEIGDTIKCRDEEDCIQTMRELSKGGIETDFLYEKDGEKGLWLEVKKINEI